MSWTDKGSIEHIKQIKNIFNVNTFIETGTYNGNNARCHACNFKNIFTCELVKENYDKAKEKLKNFENIVLLNEDSSHFLKRFSKRSDYVIYYLDAHFYDPKLPKDKRFVVLRELEVLKNNKNCIIIIHDFDNNLGHITYDGQPLNFDLLLPSLLKVNPEFKFYTNELSSCDIKKIDEAIDTDELDNLKYAWSKPEKTFRGLLYCVPRRIHLDGLKLIR